MNPYSYPNVKPHFNLRLEEATRRWSRYEVDFPIAQATCYEENNTARGEYFRPSQGNNSPLAILIHGWGDHSVIPCKLLARALVRKGIACFILYLVFHSSRMPKTVRERLPHLTPEEWFEGYKISVVDVRQILDWASRTGEINEKQIAVVGISLGGFIAAISMGVDERISAGVLLVSGGNYESPAWAKKKRDSHKEAEHCEAEKLYLQYLTEVAEKGLENVPPVKKSYLTDPMTFASYLRQRPLLMINALRDKYIPKQATLDFWQACGKPDIRWFPTSHASIWLFYPLVRKQIVDFLRSTFRI